MRRTSILAAGLLLALGIAAAPAAATTPQILYDLDSVTPAADEYDGEYPVFRFGVGGAGRALFVVRRTDPFSYEVWASDGSAAGTVPVAAFCRDGNCWGQPRLLPSAGGVGLFAAPIEGGDEGVRLWRTDGTAAGTVAISEPLDADAASATAVTGGGVLLFSGCLLDDSSCGLWRSDGSVAGTRFVAPVTAWFPVPRPIGDGSGVLFFGDDGSTSGLWRTDGTRQGTVLVRAYAVSGEERDFTVVGRRLFFMGGGTGGDLWVSDATPAGTRRLARLAGCHHYLGCGTGLLGGADDTLFLASSGKIWRTDGSPKGLVVVDPTSQVVRAVMAGRRLVYLLWRSDGTLQMKSVGASGKPVVFGGCPSGCPLLSTSTILAGLPGGRALIVAPDATGGNVDLWATDGTGAGTTRIARLSGAGAFSNVDVRNDGTRAWLGFRLADRHELWVTDGTAGGTRHVADLVAPGSDAWRSFDVVFAAGRAFFAAYDAMAGLQPWVSDGTSAGTARLLVVEARGAGSRPRDFAALPHGVAFRACDGSRTVLWASDGTPGRAPDLLLAERDGCGESTDEGPLLAAASRIFFTEPGTGVEPGVRQLWTSDGTANGTAPLTAFHDQTAGEPFVLGGKVCFFVQPLAAGTVELWESDGSAAGTHLRFALDSRLSDVDEVRSFGDRVYFLAIDSEAGAQFFASDGSESGTLRITLDSPQPQPYEYWSAIDPPRFTRLGEWVLFTLCTRSERCGIWRTRGTPETTELVVEDDVVVYETWRFAVLGNVLLYWSFGDLWRTDGTPEGTALVTTIADDLYCDPHLTVVGDRAYFVFGEDDEEHGQELWVTDGTEAGTHLFADLVPGPVSSAPSRLRAVGETLWFTASDGEHGREPWIVDPTAADPARRVRLVGDLAPGLLSSSPTALTVVGDRLYFAADDGLSGREPWVAALAP